MKSFKTFTEELDQRLQEAKKATEGNWSEVEVNYLRNATIKGTAGEYTVTVKIHQDIRTGWIVAGEVVDGEGKKVDTVYISKLRVFKTLENKWKKEVGNYVKCPDKVFLRKVMDGIHEMNSSNFFYETNK